MLHGFLSRLLRIQGCKGEPSGVWASWWRRWWAWLLLLWCEVGGSRCHLCRWMWERNILLALPVVTALERWNNKMINKQKQQPVNVCDVSSSSSSWACCSSRFTIGKISPGKHRHSGEHRQNININKREQREPQCTMGSPTAAQPD